MSPLRIISLLIIVLGTVEMSPDCAARINFLTGRNYPSGENPSVAVAQDFNNDGVSDIASANSSDQTISVFLNNGNGTFGPANTFAVGAGAAEIASADLNGDGNADLVVTDSIESAYVLLGNGDGTFGSPATISLGEISLGIAIADFNGDGILDLAIAIAGGHNSHSEAAILIGLGDGSFAPPVFYNGPFGVRLVATDLNNDGKLDLAVALFGGDKGLGVLLGNGDGTFQPVDKFVPGSATDIAVADFSGDGNVDVALITYLSREVSVVLGNGDGTFQPATTYPCGDVEFSVATADLSRDGVPDLVLGGGDDVSILLGNGDGTFGAPAHYGVGRNFARIGYFNRDRDPDVVAAADSSAIGVAFGTGDGTLRAPLVFAGGITGFDVGDFDGDGYGDIIDGDPLAFLRGLGDGTFAPGVPIADLLVGGPRATDLNGDGKLDFLVTEFFGGGIYTFLGNGDGTFQESQFTGLVSTEEVSSVADFNQDGYPDVAVTDISNKQLGILLGNGDGTFEPATYYPTDRYPFSSVAADFNDDGNPDLALCNLDGGTVAIYLGHGDGTFAAPLNIVTSDPSYVGAGDFNSDGKIDLAITAQDKVKLFLGNGDGTFQPPQVIYSHGGPLKVADLDRGGRLDITISALENFDGIVVLRGRGDGTFSSMEFPTGNFINSSFVLGDLNGDPRPEAIVNTGAYGSLLTVFVNISGPRR